MLANPRIVLLAADHPPQVVTCVDWLCQHHRFDIELRTVSAWRAGSEVMVQFDKLYPVAGIDDRLLSPTTVDPATSAIDEKTAEATRAAQTVGRIITGKLLHSGAPLTLQPTVDIPAEARSAIDTWVAEDPARGRATWTADRDAPLRWEADGRTWRPRALIRHIVREAAGLDRSGGGPACWVTTSGVDLVALAFSRRARDWSDLHDLITHIHPGEWTNYGEVQQVIGVPALAIGQHLANCDQCPHGAHRILTARGAPAKGFRWTDQTITQTCQEVLVAEGIIFDATGRASLEQKLSAADLRARGEW